ncbi:MAG: aminoacetone oxidase family FAD-binding enzyme [Ardenticatenales bacterium]|nr:aminoacetone oxidase family FAD-binding enzyme [Ardenticatenales bacterium]
MSRSTTARADTVDIAVIGAGAAGLAAALFAAERTAELGGALRIVVLDGAAKVGTKILISGGGRCNVTHAGATVDDFNGGPRPTVRNVLASFDTGAAVRWFASLGVALKAEPTGKLFPTTDRAATVLDALLGRAAALGIEIRTRSRVDDVRPNNDRGNVSHVDHVDHAADGFALAIGEDTLVARRVILATGGRSLPRTGSDGGGWAIAARLGHTVTPTFPALVPLVLDGAFWHAELSGVSHPAELTTVADGKVVDRRAGSLLWTHFGISGPVVLDASRHWLAARESAKSVELRCSVLRDGNGNGDVDAGAHSTVAFHDAHGADGWLVAAARREGGRPVGAVLGGVLPDRLARTLCRHAGVDAATRLSELTKPDRLTLAAALGALPLPVVGDRGWDFAEVTAGGVPLAEVDHRTMGSRRAPGLHLVGEMLDVDGRIGGFNFQWAWATGYLAGRGAAVALVDGGERATREPTGSMHDA